MAKTKISEFSSTPASNTDIDGINISEGCAPSGINDAIRDLMAQLKNWQSGTSNDPYVVGSSGSLTLNQGTANGVTYLNGSKVVTSGSALTYNGSSTLTLTDANPRVTLSNNSTGSTLIDYGSGGGSFYVGSDNSTGSVFGTSAYARVLWGVGNYPLVFAINNAEKMRLDSSGNLGLGVTPSAWTSAFKAFQVGAKSSLSYYNGNTYLSSNYYNDGTSAKYITTDYASQYNQTSGQHQWFTAPSGTAGNAITFTQAMTLDASGNLVIGGTTANQKLQVTGTGPVGIRINDTNTNFWDIINNSYLSFTRGSTEAMRIDSSGNLLVGVTSLVSASGGNYGVALRRFASGASYTGRLEIGHGDSSGARLGAFYYGSTPTSIGSIDGTTTTTSYNTSSDYRLKNTITPMTGALAKVTLLKPCTYKWNVDGSDGEGFIAHELAEVCPQAVTGEKDAVDEDGNPQYQGIDVSFLVATLTAAIQEQQALITKLQADVAALKA